MNIVWFSWKDHEHPQAGSTEQLTETFAQQLVKDGHEVVLVTSGLVGGVPKTTRGGVRIVRLGNSYTVYVKAWRYYKQQLADWADVIVEEVNTLPFFTNTYVRQPVVLLYHQACRELWFYQTMPPLSLLGYALEPLYIRMLHSPPVMVPSDSTRQELQRYGFRLRNMTLMPMGSMLAPVPDLTSALKYRQPTVLSMGSLQPAQRTHHQIKAFNLAKASVPDLQLIIASDARGRYGDHIKHLIQQSPFRDDIRLLGKVPPHERVRLLRRCHFLLATSVKEGWGLGISEAASQGTPAIAYDVHGLRDSVRHEQTGLLCHTSPAAMAACIIEGLADTQHYKGMRRTAWELSRHHTLNKGYKVFVKTLTTAYRKRR